MAGAYNFFLLTQDGALKSECLEKARTMLQSGGFLFDEELAETKQDSLCVFKISACPQDALMAEIRQVLFSERVDVLSIPKDYKPKLLMADMDSTIVTGETLDELAEFAGVKDKVADITARAMNGEVDFKDALRERVALLEGLSETALSDTLEKAELSSGAKDLISSLKENGVLCVLVSGGFTYFTSAIAEQAGFDFHHGNRLEIKDGVLTGQVIEPILDRNAKVAFMDRHCTDLGISFADCLAIGDGANDLPMLLEAGVGIGYRAKPAVASQLLNVIQHISLDRIPACF